MGPYPAALSVGLRRSVFGRPPKALQGYFYRLGVVTDPYRSVLDRDLQHHGPLYQSGEALALLGGDLPDAQIAQAGEPVFEVLPPSRCIGMEVVDREAFDAGGGSEQSLFVRLTEIDPVGDAPGSILLPETRFIGLPHVLGQLERAFVQ